MICIAIKLKGKHWTNYRADILLYLKDDIISFAGYYIHKGGNMYDRDGNLIGRVEGMQMRMYEFTTEA